MPGYGQEYLLLPSPINRYLQQNSVTGFGRDNKGYLWVSTQFGIYRYDGVQVQPFLPGSGGISGSFRFIYVQKTFGGQLVAASETGLYALADGQVRPLVTGRGQRVLENSHALRVLPATGWLATQPQRVWTDHLLAFDTDTLVYQTQGLVQLRSGKTVLVASRMANNQYRTIGGRVLCLNNSGLYQVHWNGQQLQHSLLLPLAGKKLWVANSQEACWFQNNHVLLHFDAASRQVRYQLPIPKGDIEGVSAVFADSAANRLYLGTPTAGVMEMRLFNGTVHNSYAAGGGEDYIYTYAPHPREGYLSISAQGLIHYRNSGAYRLLASGPLNTSFVYTDSAGRAWFSTDKHLLQSLDLRTGKLLHRFAWQAHIQRVTMPNSHTLQVVSRRAVQNLHLPGGKVYTLFSLPEGHDIQTALQQGPRLWIGTTNGLFLAQAGKPTTQLLAGKSVRSLLALRPELLAIGTYGYGTWLLQHNRLYALPAGANNVSVAVVNLALDADSALWVLCNKGAFIWNKEQWQHPAQLTGESAYFLETSTELPVNELNGGQTPQRFGASPIVLPSSRGLVVFNKKDVLRENAPLSLALGQVLLGGQPAPAGRHLTLQPYQQQLQVHINAPYFGSVYNLGTRYRLLGLDTEWLPLADRRLLRYERLQPGTYTLQVKTSSRQAPLSLLEVQVMPPWYQRPLLVVLALTALAALLYLAYHTRMLRLRKEQQQLEAIIDTKTRELQQTVAKLSRSRKELLQQYRHRNRLYSILMHDLKSPLQFLSVYSIERWQQHRQQPVSADALKVMAETSTELSGFINQFLVWLGRQNKKKAPAVQLTDICALSTEVVQLYQHITLLQGNRLLLFCSPNLHFPTDADLLRTILRNLVDNANKYTRNGIIKLQCALEEGKLVVGVSDSGKGMPAAVAAQLSKPISEAGFAPSINANHKLGLQICREFIARLQGQLHIETKPQEGTTITLRFPPVV